MHIVLTTAKAEDAAILVGVIRASITELCAADHNDEDVPLNEWLSNKTIDNMLTWIAKPALEMLVAKVDGEIAGMGTCNDQGRILMNYVSPDFRFMGVSKIIMTGLENHVRGLGLAQATLESSQTALEFYQSIGWEILAAETDKFEMKKLL